MTGALAGKVALITGASRGIGEALARRFAHEGAHVIAVARTCEPTDRMPGSLRETVNTIERCGGTATAVTADLAKPEDRARIAAEAIDAAGASALMETRAT